ncbi:MAG: hypothetical protein HWQ38_00810 [Nostoc sp. NMS7]|uniref:hypothetical protein n=1 Tax=Nostoc sp. NMS7 TaxID=2815391 RepID=UPI0025FF7970|nr:hypothetical protein [Nostoc sp. NMS7]MBN3945099.1 hypothetical protein [Nostoc sp. NMS7]
MTSQKLSEGKHLSDFEGIGDAATPPRHSSRVANAQCPMPNAQCPTPTRAVSGFNFAILVKP